MKKMFASMLLALTACAMTAPVTADELERINVAEIRDNYSAMLDSAPEHLKEYVVSYDRYLELFSAPVESLWSFWGPEYGNVFFLKDILHAGDFVSDGTYFRMPICELRHYLRTRQAFWLDERYDPYMNRFEYDYIHNRMYTLDSELPHFRLKATRGEILIRDKKSVRTEYHFMHQCEADFYIKYNYAVKDPA